MTKTYHSKPVRVRLTDIYRGTVIEYKSKAAASVALGRDPKYIHHILHKKEFARGTDGRVYDCEVIKDDKAN